jgi:hypothetical protein
VAAENDFAFELQNLTAIAQAKKSQRKRLKDQNQSIGQLGGN